MKFIHLSDLHIGKSDNKKRLGIIVDWIIANQDEHKSNVIIITGDIVDDGALGQYRKAKSYIEKLKKAKFVVLPTPGNHDYGTNGIVESWECVARYRKYISGDVDYPHLLKEDGCAFIMLDSMLQEMVEHELWGAQGELGKQQLNELDRILNEIEEDDPGMKVVVALHHHPFYYRHFLKLRDDDLLKKVIRDEDRHKSRVHCLVFGHKHVDHRFNGKGSKEKKYNIGVIHSAGSSTERDDDGKLIVPVIDLETNLIDHYEAVPLEQTENTP